MKRTNADADAGEARRRARASWAVRVFRPGEEQADADALFWDSIPMDQRAEMIWQLSCEMFELAFPGVENERRLPRSAFRVVRR